MTGGHWFSCCVPERLKKKKSHVNQVFRWPWPTDGMVLDYDVRGEFHKSIVIVVFGFVRPLSRSFCEFSDF